MESISIIGAGSWGTALSTMLAKKGYDVSIWDRNENLLSEIDKTRENSRYLPGVIVPQNVKVCFDPLE